MLLASQYICEIYRYCWQINIFAGVVNATGKSISLFVVDFAGKLMLWDCEYCWQELWMLLVGQQLEVVDVAEYCWQVNTFTHCGNYCKSVRYAEIINAAGWLIGQQGLQMLLAGQYFGKVVDATSRSVPWKL